MAVWTRPGERCLDYRDHTVIETTAKGLNTTIAVFPSTLRCRQSDQSRRPAATFTKQGEAEDVSGLIGDVLVTDSGTGPDGRTLTLYRLKTQAKLRELFDYSDPVVFKPPSKLLVWLPARRATAQNCKSYNQWRSMGLGAVIEAQVVINLNTNKLETTAHERCNSRQVPVH